MDVEVNAEAPIAYRWNSCNNTTLTYCAMTWKTLPVSVKKVWEGTAILDLINCGEVMCLFACHNKVQAFFPVYSSLDNLEQK
jgi:hypothetical protein